MASRRKALSLSELIEAEPGEKDWDALFDEIDSQSDRGAALIAGALLDQTLTLALQCRFVEMSNDRRKRLFVGSDAPLGTWSGRTKMARAIGIYGAKTERAIDRIRNIRNVFAHALVIVDFSTPAIAEKARKLPAEDHERIKNKNRPEGRLRYVATCIMASFPLVHDAVKHGGREISVVIP